MRSFHRSMYLRHVHYFVAAAEYGSFRRAAAALNVRQSSVSRRIRDLEARIGKILFLRSAKGVVLTEAGHHLLGPLKEALCRLEQTSQTSQDDFERDSKPMIVGLSPFLTGTLLPQLVRAFRGDVRDIDLTFFDQADITRKNQSASIDIAIAPYNLMDWRMLSPSFVMDHVAVIVKKEIDAA